MKSDMKREMIKQADFPLNIGLSEEEKNDLEKMIDDFQKDRLPLPADQDLASIPDTRQYALHLLRQV